MKANLSLVKYAGLAGKLWKLPLCGNRGKTKKQFFHRFHHRLENSPQKARVEFSTVPTASAATFFPRKETGEKRRNPGRRNRNWVARESSGITRKLGWSTRNLNRGRLGESFFLTTPFIERGEGLRSPSSLQTFNSYGVAAGRRLFIVDQPAVCALEQTQRENLTRRPVTPLS